MPQGDSTVQEVNPDAPTTMAVSVHERTPAPKAVRKPGNPYLRKFRRALTVLRSEGLLKFAIRVLVYIDWRLDKTKFRVNTGAAYEDVVQADISRPHPKWQGTSKKELTFNWIMPPPSKGSGGHHGIFRFMQFLEQAGHRSRIYMYLADKHLPVSEIRTKMGNSFPNLTAEMQWLEPGAEMDPADGIFATSWETAYPAFNSQLVAKRFYFAQDFEPYFFPAGSHHAFAENTYRMGFFGVTAGGWLAKKLHEDYGMTTENYGFGADRRLYHRVATGPRKEIFFYARPVTERRGFEMGVMALDLFHREHPDYKINFAGWETKRHNIPFPYHDYGVLEVEQLNELYNRCAVGLVLSFSNLSLLPLELMSAGTIPVVNDAQNNRLVSDNPYICYTAPQPRAIANAIASLATRKDFDDYSREAAASVELSTWEEQGKKFVEIVERRTREAE